MLSEIDNFTADEHKQYLKSLENMGDYQNIINTAVEEAEIRGHAKGLEEGREEGRAEGREEGHAKGLEEGHVRGLMEVARKLMDRGMSKEEAADFVGIPVERLDL